MPEEKSSGFFFDVAKWRGSRAVQRMSFTERGVYLEMMLEQWEKRTLPDDPQAVADAIASTEAQVADVMAAWPAVRRKFMTSRGDETRIYNEALEKTRRKQRDYHKSKQEAGRAGGKAKAVNRSNTGKLSPSSAQANPSSASACSSSDPSKPTDLTRYDLNRHEVNRSEVNGSDVKRSDLAERFDTFWQAYPKKVGKDEARKAWAKRRPTDALLAEILNALGWQQRSNQWQSEGGKYIPNPATWLNQGRWQDGPPTTGDLLSETARYNLAASEEAGRLIEEAEHGRKAEH